MEDLWKKISPLSSGKWDYVIFVGEQFHQGKCSSPSQNFVTFPQQSFSNKVTLIVALNICLMLLINHFKMLNDNNSF